MRPNTFTSALIKSGLAASVLLLAAGASHAQSVNLTAGPVNAITPDGSTVPMWGYSCGAGAVTATCAPLNPLSVATTTAPATWSPVVITVPYSSTGTSLTINLTNNLTFAGGSIPTSLVIVGQIGGGLGTVGTGCTSGTTCTASQDHTFAQSTATWPIVSSTVTTGTPPTQGPRVQSFGTEVASGTTAALCWGPACTPATPALKPGTYLIESGSHPSIQGPMGLYGMLVVTSAPTTTAGCAYPGATATAACVVPYNTDVSVLMSEIDPVQNNAVQVAVGTAGFSETMVWSGQPGGCGNPASTTFHQCYPPAVNYTPLYYLINGVAFDKTHAANSLFAATTGATVVNGTALVRMVNAGLRMHVPSIVGALTNSTSGTTVTAVPGLTLVAEDGNPLPGVPRIQSEVFMAAGKTYDVAINAPAAASAALPIFDRELSLSGNAISRDAGMLAYLGINGATPPASPTAVARNDTYNSVITGQTLVVSDPGKGVIANDTNVYGVQLIGTVAGLTLNANGTFTYTGAPTSFSYCANGTVTSTGCSSGITATASLNAAPTELGGGITVNNDTYSATIATKLTVQPPGILLNDADTAGYPLTVNLATATAPRSVSAACTGRTGSATVSVDSNGGFSATAPTGTTAATCTFTYQAKSSRGTVSAGTATVTLNFPATTPGFSVTVLGKDNVKGTTATINDYRWIIEEDRTFYVNPACTANPPPAGCPSSAQGIVPTFGTNFHTSYMPLVAAGCTGPLSCESGQTVVVPAGGHSAAVCDVGNGVCRTNATSQAITSPNNVHLDPTKRYYITVFPGDAANPFEGGATGHGMGGAPISCTPAVGTVACTATTGAFTPVTVYAVSTPLPPAKLAVFVFEDDFPLNGEHDGGGGIDVLSPVEPGLGGFNIKLFDDAGGTGDATGQMSYDMFNYPLSNSLSGTIDPATGLDACPISAAADGITGEIVTCPKYESDGATLSPIAGQAVVANLMPGRYGVVATPAADRIARGEEWLQTNTLDGQKAHDSFLRVGEPSFFQEYGPSGYHVSIGFANPQIIKDRLQYVCNGTDANITGTGCHNTLKGQVTTERMSRTPDERLYSSGTYNSFAFTQCYVSFGDADGEDFAFTKCNADGTFTLTGLPDGDWRITVFDQWNDMLVDGLSTPVRLNSTNNSACGNASSGSTCNLGDIAMNQWQANIYTSTFFDANGNGVFDSNETGLTLVATNIRFRDGSYSNFNNTDLAGNAGFNEIFPLFSWYVIETDTTRYKTTGTHVVYDAGGPADGTCTPTTAPCGSSSIAANMANTAETVPLPTNLRVPGAWYCTNGDCTDAPAPLHSGGSGGSTGRVDPPIVHPYGSTYGWQGFSGQNSFLEFGKKPYADNETGGIHGEVIYASTRPFDDPTLLIHTSWTPDVPGVTINLYQEGTAPDGSTSLKLVDTTKTSSFDDWAQGFRSPGIPNMNCPGQGRDTGTNADLFFFSLFNQPDYLDVYQHGWAGATALPNNSQFKCYDGMHNWNQLQPAPYDGMYQFPSITSLNPTTGKPAGTNCAVCVPNPDTSDPFRSGTPMLPAGKYVVEVVVPPGYELVKEEDKNILIGDVYIAPATTQFGALASIFILPDQAEISALYNANNAQNPTQTFGRTSLPSHEGDTGSVETFWPCVGQQRIVPDYISLFPQSHEVAPFAGALRPLCDRKEVTLDYQTGALAKFWVFTSAHIAAHFTGVITDDYTSEFDPFSPQFGEKFSPADLPVSIKDWTGTEISRVYADHWGTYNGLTYSTWEVNPPNPTGYAPTMMVTCMNDPGTGATPDPLYNPSYSDFCYEIPFMPGQTQYMDTPVVPTSAFAGAGYNNPDCAYPDLTPAIKEVDGSGVGPWVSAAGGTLTITALGDVTVNNYAYVGPSGNTAPYNRKFVTRHYGFGGSQGTGSVTIGGLPATVTSWSDTTITVTVPAGVPNCPITQQGQSAAQCGELVITAANGKQSIDTITVTIGGKAPVHVAATASVQAAIDAATPGDMLMIDPTCTSTTGTTVACAATGQTHAQAAHQEMLLVWKPVRLQGVGAVSSIINANPHPAGKIEAWRIRVDCLFGLATNGSPVTGSNPFDAYGTGATCPAAQLGAVDRLPLEATVGWDASLNGNLAELLQEPALMGALEGAALTVLAKGVDFHGANQFDPTLLGGFPTGTTLLRSTNCGTSAANNPFKSNFWCNPSSIDGLGITNSSQGGGGIFVHGWGHNLQIANNRVYNNAGTLSGGINVGQGEFPPSYIQGSATNAAPGSCQSSAIAGIQLPYCHNLNVNMHNNSVTSNSSTGDELFSATPAGAGGVSICTGSDFYKFNYNWVCGNLSTGDGGGLGHMGFSYNGDIEHNSILFNQSTNPTIPANGGGLLVMGAPDADPTCGATTDQDCVPAPSSITPSDGTGPNLVINANLIMGNAAESGSGGGVMFQQVNGTDVTSLPTTPARWNSVSFTNNIVANNVAGWDGAGISLLDSLNVNIINNTIMSNDTTASSGVLFNTLGAPLASTQGPTCTSNCGTASAPQPAGLVTIQNSAVLTANLPATITCPAGHFTSTSATNGNCRSWSVPLLYNDVFWQNRVFNIQVGALGGGTTNQQNVVSLVPTLTQATTGQCLGGSSYWDLGARGDTGSGNHNSGLTLAPTFSDLTSTAGYTGAGNEAANPNVVSQYCNGSRIPPEYQTACPAGTGCSAAGYYVPPGISDATVPNPIFNLTPAATVDEGNNWVNIAWGPLSLTNPTVQGADLNYGGGPVLGNYRPFIGSPIIDAGTASASSIAAPTTDFFGNPRPQGAAFDIGAVEGGVAGGGGGTATLAVTPTSHAFGNQTVGTTSAAFSFTLSNSGGAGATGITVAVTAPFARSGGTCGATLAAATTCTINVVFSPTAAGAATGTATITANVAVAGSPVSLTGTGTAVVAGTASVSPTSLAFGNQAVGTTSTSQTVTVTNTGTVALAGGAFTFGGGTPTGFARAGGGGGGTCGTTLAVGASCSYNVVFSPTAVTSFSRTLTVAYTGTTVTGSPVALTGTGTGTAAVTVTPTSLTFGAQATGTTSAFQTLTLNNTTAAAFTGLTATFTGPFSRAGGGGANCGTTLASGATCTIRAQFSPTAVGTATGSVAITGSATVVNSPVTLSGTGVQALTASPNPLTITLAAGTNPRSGNGTVTLTNPAAAGGASVTVTGVTVPVGGSATTWMFTKATDNCTGVTLAPGGTCTVVVTFTNTSSASGVNRTATMSVAHNGITDPSVTLIGHAN